MMSRIAKARVLVTCMQLSWWYRMVDSHCPPHSGSDVVFLRTTLLRKFEIPIHWLSIYAL